MESEKFTRSKFMPWSSFRGHAFTRLGGQQYGQSQIKTLIVSRLSGDMMGQFTDHLPPMSPPPPPYFFSPSSFPFYLRFASLSGPGSRASSTCRGLELKFIDLLTF